MFMDEEFEESYYYSDSILGIDSEYLAGWQKAKMLATLKECLTLEELKSTEGLPTEWVLKMFPLHLKFGKEHRLIEDLIYKAFNVLMSTDFDHLPKTLKKSRWKGRKEILLFPENYRNPLLSEFISYDRSYIINSIHETIKTLCFNIPVDSSYFQMTQNWSVPIRRNLMVILINACTAVALRDKIGLKSYELNADADFTLSQYRELILPYEKLFGELHPEDNELLSKGN
jgi:hypothetical protein